MAAANRRSCSSFPDGNMSGCHEASTPGTQSDTIKVEMPVVETKRRGRRDNEDHQLVLIMNEIISWARRPSETTSAPLNRFSSTLVLPWWAHYCAAEGCTTYLLFSIFFSSIFCPFFLGGSFLFALRSCCTLHFPALIKLNRCALVRLKWISLFPQAEMWDSRNFLGSGYAYRSLTRCLTSSSRLFFFIF